MTIQFIFFLRLNVCNDLAEVMKALDGKKSHFGCWCFALFGGLLLVYLLFFDGNFITIFCPLQFTFAVSQ